MWGTGTGGCFFFLFGPSFNLSLLAVRQIEPSFMHGYE